MTDKAKTYLDNMDMAITDHFTNPESIYSGKDGHLRFAREFGYALNDFSEDEQRDIIQGSYSKIYVKHCALKPILNAKEWISEMRKAGERVKTHSIESKRIWKLIDEARTNGQEEKVDDLLNELSDL